jgi:hypothetical protein
VTQKEEESLADDGQDSPELSKMEIEMAKQNFTFYCSQKKSGPVLEVYELPMILSACGYKTTAEIHAQLGEYLVQ